MVVNAVASPRVPRLDQARATELHPTLGNGQLLGLSYSAARAERVACMPGWAHFTLPMLQ